MLHDNAGVPLVSIVIPTFNQCRFLGEAIQSALEQTYPNKEVIVVDNSSTDDTQGVLKAFEVRGFIQDNCGPSGARNRGVREAKGEYVVFLDGDDVLHPECAEVRAGMLRSSADVGLVVGSFAIVDAERNPLWVESLPLTGVGEVSLEMMLAEMYGPTCGMTVRKVAFEAVGGFDETYHIAEDSDLAIRMTANSGTVYDPEPRAEYRQAGASLSRNYLLLFDSYWRMAKRNSDLLDSKDRYWAIVKPRVQDRLANLIFGKLVKERKFGAVPTLLSLFVRRPATFLCFLYWVKRALGNRLPGTTIHIKNT